MKLKQRSFEIIEVLVEFFVFEDFGESFHAFEALNLGFICEFCEVYLLLIGGNIVEFDVKGFFGSVDEDVDFAKAVHSGLEANLLQHNIVMDEANLVYFRCCWLPPICEAIDVERESAHGEVLILLSVLKEVDGADEVVLLVEESSNA